MAAKRKKKPTDKQSGNNGTGNLKPWKKGQSGNPRGRPKGIDFRKAVEEHAKKNGLDLSLATWEVAEAMRAAALKGDVPAAKLWLDRVCGVLKHELEMSGTQTVNIAEQARRDFLEIARRSGLQDAMLDELEKRSN